MCRVRPPLQVPGYLVRLHRILKVVAFDTLKETESLLLHVLQYSGIFQGSLVDARNELQTRLTLADAKPRSRCQPLQTELVFKVPSIMADTCCRHSCRGWQLTPSTGLFIDRYSTVAALTKAHLSHVNLQGAVSISTSFTQYHCGAKTWLQMVASTAG
jgi:hypothetical protein